MAEDNNLTEGGIPHFPAWVEDGNRAGPRRGQSRGGGYEPTGHCQGRAYYLHDRVRRARLEIVSVEESQGPGRAATNLLQIRKRALDQQERARSRGRECRLAEAGSRG